MVGKIISRGKKILVSPQTSVLSAASIIMLMVIASRVLGLIRQRVLAHFFAPSELSLFFAAFRLPDLVFEVLVFGTFSSAFIPVFTRTLKKGNHKAWDIASTVMNIGMGLFVILALVIGVGADPLYSLFAPGYSGAEREVIVKIARILFAAQGFFVVSYVLTSVLESLRRFLVPALAPLFYNIGIILGTILLSSRLGLMGPTIGVLFGAFFHFIVQLPLAVKLGFRFSFEINITKEVKKIGKLALPRVVEVSFLQLSKMAELFFASLITTAAYTYYTFGNTLRFLPVGLFGVSIAKAALPTLSRESGSLKKFRKTFLSSLHDIVFLVLPIATILIVLRIPIVRLVYGTDIFSWEATVQTGLVVSAFAVGVVFESAVALFARSFYALHDTRTPVIVSIVSILLIIAVDYVLIRVLGLPVWGLAAAFSAGVFFQALILYILLNKKLKGISFAKFFSPIIKSAAAALASGGVMYFILKIFDRSVWVKRLSFLGKIEQTKTFPFEKFVLDTRYTINLLILTIVVSFVGAIVYLGVAMILKTDQVWRFFGLVRRIFVKRKVAPIPERGSETVAPPTGDTTSG
jgi:putative peptidoglycan lipid II flippase